MAVGQESEPVLLAFSLAVWVTTSNLLPQRLSVAGSVCRQPAVDCEHAAVSLTPPLPEVKLALALPEVELELALPEVELALPLLR